MINDIYKNLLHGMGRFYYEREILYTCPHKNEKFSRHQNDGVKEKRVKYGTDMGNHKKEMKIMITRINKDLLET